MAVLDRPLRRAAKTVLRKLGAPVTVTLIDKASSYNTAQGREPKTSTVVSTHGYELSAKKSQRSGESGSITRNAKWIVPALDFTSRGPRANDVLTAAGKQHRVIAAVAHSTGQLAGLYELEVAR